MKLLLSLMTGIIAGGIFAFLRLPVPAPGTWEGILGIFGLFLGYLLVRFLLRNL